MPNKTISIIVPAVTGESFNEAEIFGAVVRLWMHSDLHKNAPLNQLSSLLTPAIKNQQFVLACEDQQPVFYMAWAMMNARAERRYLRNPPQCMLADDWTSGERTWIVDWVAPFGHTRVMKRLIAERIFPERHSRTLYHHGEKTGLRVMTFRGSAVTREEARFWSKRHPIEIEHV